MREPSISSIRLPSSDSSLVPTPSPPRPRSPVFGKPPTESIRRIPISKSLHLHHISSDFTTHLARCLSPGCQKYANSPPSVSDDEENVAENEEVWPESEVVYRNEFHGWDDDPAVNRLPRSRSTFERVESPEVMPHSRSAHFNFTQWPEVGGSVDTHVFNSSHSLLNENEMVDYEGRQDWIEKGSVVTLNLDDEVWQLREEFKNRGVVKTPMYGLREMRRSATTDAFRKPSQTRRRLPKRPDLRNEETMDNIADLPSSISMYGRLLRDETNEYSIQYDYTVHSRYRNIASSHSYTTIQNDYHHPPIETVPPVQYRSRQPSEWIRTNNYDDRHAVSSKSSAENDPPVQNQRQDRPPDLPLRLTQFTHQGGARSPLAALSRKDNPYADLETPMSPPAHALPSPALSTGRRLPALPVRNSILDSLPTMSQISQPTHSAHPTKEDHRLCFGMESMMGRSALEDSYYEEDGMNGNNNFGGGRRMRKSFFSPDDSSGVSSCTGSESLNPTHRVQSAFVPRHNDEVLLEIGDAVHVDRTCEDHWCYGTNLRSGQHGIFPSAVVCEIDLVEEICMGALPTNTQKILSEERDTFYLTLLASIEVAHHKGNDVLVQAINKVLSLYKNREEIIVPQTVLMEISFRGIHVIDKRKRNFFQCPTFDFFYSLQNISFCGAHPKQLKYFAFITKHPLLPKFACHVFLSNESTQPIVESIGRAFKRSYDEYMAFAHPTEDIYLE